MKVLHVITNFSGKGGAEMMLSRIIEALPDDEHYLVSLMSISGVYDKTVLSCKKVYALDWTIGSTIQVIFKLYKIIEEVCPDIVQCWMYHANVISSFAHVLSGRKGALLWGVHHSLNDYPGEKLSVKVALWLSRALRRIPDKIIYCSKVGLQQHRAFGFKNVPDVFIPNGVPLSYYAAHSLEAGCFEKKTWVIGSAGRFHPAKGYPYLLNAAKAVVEASPQTKVLLCGRGIDENNKSFIGMMLDCGFSASSKELSLLGEIDDMSKFYSSIDLFVLSSVTEGFPNVLIECMAAGLPCVTTDVGDAAEIVGETGFVVKPKSPSQLASAILRYFVLPPEEKMRRSLLAREKAFEMYSLPKVAKKYRDVWEDSALRP